MGIKWNLRIRKTHRYLGLFLGIQFLFWTVSGLYFSWTNLDRIHGDHFKKPVTELLFKDLVSPSSLDLPEGISSIALREIAGAPHYYINNKKLYHAQNGSFKPFITEEEAKAIAAQHIRPEYQVVSVEKITEVDAHHEYRERLLPAYVISYATDESLKAYVSITDGKFQTVRHRDWRIFDFLWMTHTMDYQGRDDFNTLTLRIFSLLGLVTVFSGFLLWFVSTPIFRKMRK